MTVQGGSITEGRGTQRVVNGEHRGGKGKGDDAGRFKVAKPESSFKNPHQSGEGGN